MSGIFRCYASNSPPIKRATLSPFCTSPGQLQDVTMDQSYALGYRSPCTNLPQYNGSTSPAQGRSVREFEEQMAALRKENFNLKLRLYFIEESIPGCNQDGQESFMKQLIDSKVEMEILKKEMHEKQELLKEAAQALSQMEKNQKDSELKSQAIIDDLNHKIQFLEMENREIGKSQQGQLMNELVGRSDISSNINAVQKIRELEGIVEQSDEKINEYQEQLYKLDEELLRRDQVIKEFEEKVKELSFQNSELQELFEDKKSEVTGIETQQLREEIQAQKRELAEKVSMLEEAAAKVKDTNAQHEQACKVVQKLMLNIKNLQEEIDRLKKTNRSSSSKSKEETIDEKTANIHTLSEGGDLAEGSSSHEEMEKLLEQKDVEIRKLKAEINKKTASLQNLVNKELWEKNREIERLTKLINTPTSLPTSPFKESDQLKQSFTDVEYNEALDRNKALQKKVDVLIHRLGALNDYKADATIEQLKKELKEAKEETVVAEKWRMECAEVCNVLTARLEELAGFLDSLLKHKDVLGILAADRRRAMRKAVDRSLDFSRSINNLSFSMSANTTFDQSFHFSNISELLALSVSNKENIMDNSLGEARSENIEVLHAELKALKKELDKTRCSEVKRDRRSLPITFENQSESEAWSEPDRKVSLARIGLEENLLPQPIKQEHSTDSDSDLNKSRSKSKIQERIVQLEEIITQKDEKILKIQCDLVEADSLLKKENLKLIELTKEMQKLKDYNEDLQSELIAYKNNEKIESNGNSQAAKELEEKTHYILKLQEERDLLFKESQVTRQQVHLLSVVVDEMKQKVVNAKEEESKKLKTLERELTETMSKQLSALQQQHQETLERNWVSRNVYEDCKNRFDKLEKKLVEAESLIDYLKENEADNKKALVDFELSVRSLKKTLDETTLQASKAVLERTKALNDKRQLESRLEDLHKQIEVLETEKVDFISQITALEQKATALDKSLNRSTDPCHSGYTSDDVPVNNNSPKSDGQRANNTSPDLGIDSDVGRASSVELSSTHLTKMKTVELKADQKIYEETSEDINANEAEQDQLCKYATDEHNCLQVQQENAELRSKLTRTKRALHDTYNKLRLANQRKELIEREIKNQIVRTHNVLKNVRSNMEN